jgi:hypothetical protein
VDCEESVMQTTGPVAKSMNALALQIEMSIGAFALEMNRDRDIIWKDLREGLDRIIGLRYDPPPTSCADVRGGQV